MRSRLLLRSAPVMLEAADRLVVLRALLEVCQHRGWSMAAAHVRTNHVHVVVTAGAPPERIMGDLKAWSTRRLVEAGQRSRGARVWVRGGSRRVLWDQAAIVAARFYVLKEQGEPLPGEPSWPQIPP
jgi:REP element-mobilizing transposase RayT